MLGLVLGFLSGPKSTSKKGSEKKETERLCEKQGREHVNNLQYRICKNCRLLSFCLFEK